MGGKDLSYWFRMGRIGSIYGSASWLSFHKIEGLFLKNLIWSFQSGIKILIGMDTFLSRQEDMTLLKALLKFFHMKGYFTWDKLIAEWNGPLPI